MSSKIVFYLHSFTIILITKLKLPRPLLCVSLSIMTMLDSKVAIGIQARLSSTRFPKKVLAPFLGVTVIENLLLNLSKQSIPTFVLTSKESSDLPLVAHLTSRKIPLHQGSLNSLIYRYFSFMDYHGLEYVIRISGDSPLLHPRIVQDCIHLAELHSNFDLVTNVFPRTFPSGQSVEIIPKRTLARLLDENLDENCHEHLTLFIYKNSKKFRILNHHNPFLGKLPKMSLDNFEELNQLELIGEYMKRNDLLDKEWIDCAESIWRVKTFR